MPDQQVITMTRHVLRQTYELADLHAEMVLNSVGVHMKYYHGGTIERHSANYVNRARILPDEGIFLHDHYCIRARISRMNAYSFVTCV